MSASDLPAPPRRSEAFWPAPETVRMRTRALFAPGMVLPAALDGARGLAALLVLGFHLRTWLTVPYAEAAPHGPVLMAFYLATTFGHEAVIVFFVLSGFLIGGAVLRMDFAAPGAVARYAAARLARIGPVLFGAVALAVALRALVAPWTADPSCRDGVATVAGNLLALGNLGVPVLCNDMPLWSLSNEVVYYIAFPTLVALARGRRSPGVAAACVSVLALCGASLAFTPWDQQNVVAYFPAWLAGAALWWLPAPRTWPAWPGLGLFVLALAASRMPGAAILFLPRDALTTLGFTALLAGLMGRAWPVAGVWRRLARPLSTGASALAAISFSLYVTHNPVIDAAERWAVRRGTVLPMTTVSAPFMTGLFAACLATALVFSLVFERSHRAVAARLAALLDPRGDRTRAA